METEQERDESNEKKNIYSIDILTPNIPSESRVNRNDFSTGAHTL